MPTFSASEDQHAETLLVGGRDAHRLEHDHDGVRDAVAERGQRPEKSASIFSAACKLGKVAELQSLLPVTFAEIRHQISEMHSLAYAALPIPDTPRRSAAITDLDAVASVLSGNREMFEVIVRRYNTQLYRVGMAYLRNHEQTEDAMQNAYLKAFLNLERFRGNAAFATVYLLREMQGLSTAETADCLENLAGERESVPTRCTWHFASRHPFGD